jgi:ABC-type uncharacterized transport system ATPase subunit
MEQAFRQSVLEGKGNGQTVVLSWHILGEVEALCDRVAILRAGQAGGVGAGAFGGGRRIDEVPGRSVRLGSC